MVAGRYIAKVFHFFGGKMQGEFNRTLRQGRVRLINFGGWRASLYEFQNLPNHHSSTAKHRLPVAN